MFSLQGFTVIGLLFSLLFTGQQVESQPNNPATQITESVSEESIVVKKKYQDEINKTISEQKEYIPEKELKKNIPSQVKQDIPVVNRLVSDNKIPEVITRTEINTAKKIETSRCHPSYSGCLEIDAYDYDCIGGTGDGPLYTGKVQVFGSDPFRLDRDKDGFGCE